MSFDGFISYSHAADGQLAPALQRGLHRLAKPWHRRRALWIFRDQTGLAVTPALWSSIQQALDGSEWFVLLASPEAAQSPWVNREIEHWIATKPAERILPVVTDGTWAWDAARGDLSPDSTAVPDSLRGVFAEEPLYLDLRWARDDQQLNLRHSRFRDAVAQLAAPMHGVSKDDLEGEDVRQHRRGRRLRRVAVAAVVLLTVVASMTGVLAGHNADRATASAAEALRQERAAAEQRANAEQFAAEARRQEANAGTQEERARAAAEETERQQANAQEQQRAAELAAAEARRQQANARKQQELAKRAQSLAEEQRELARAQSELAQQSSRETKRQQIIAERQQRLADEAKAEAEQQKKVAQEQQMIAAEAAAEAKRQEAVARENEKKAKEAAEEAKRQEANAAEQKKIAIGRRLLNQAKATVGYDPEAALRLGVAAQQIQPGPEARGGLAGLLASSRRVGYAEGEFLSITYGPKDVLAVVQSDFSAALWSVADRSAPVRLAGLDGSGFTGKPVFSPDHKTLAVPGADYLPVIFDVSDPTRPTLLGTVPAEFSTSLKFSPDGRTLAVINGLDNEWTLWDMVNRESPTLLTRQNEGTPHDIDFSPDGKTVMTSGSPGHVWDITDRTKPAVVGKMNGDWVFIDHSPTRPLVVTNNMDRELAFWSLEGQAPRKITTLTDINGVAFSPDGQTLLTGTSDGGARLWDLTGNTPVQMGQVNDGSGDLAAWAFSPDNRILATTGAVGSLSLWTIAAHGEPARRGQPAGLGTGHTTVAATLGPDAKRLTTAYNDGSAIVWDLSGPAGPVERATVRLPGKFWAAGVSPDGTILASIDQDDFFTVQLTDISNPSSPTALGVLPDSSGDEMTFSPDGKTLAVYQTDELVLWDITDPRKPGLLKRLRLDEDVQTAAFSPDGRTLALATERNVTLYSMADPKNPEKLGKLKGHTDYLFALAFSPDGRTLATGAADRTAAVWNVADLKRVRRQAVVTGLGAQVWSVAFAPDGNTLAIGTEDDRATVWDVTERSAPVRVTTMNRADLRSKWLLFHPDGRTLTTAGGTYGNPSRVAVWDYTPLNSMRANPAAVACAAVSSGLTPDDWTAYIPEFEYQKTCS